MVGHSKRLTKTSHYDWAFWCLACTIDTLFNKEQTTRPPEELLSRGHPGGVVGVYGHVPGGGTVGRVPLVVAGRPGKLATEGGHQVVDAPRQDGVIVHRHV